MRFTPDGKRSNWLGCARFPNDSIGRQLIDAIAFFFHRSLESTVLTRASKLGIALRVASVIRGGVVTPRFVGDALTCVPGCSLTIGHGTPLALLGPPVRPFHSLTRKIDQAGTIGSKAGLDVMSAKRR